MALLLNTVTSSGILTAGNLLTAPGSGSRRGVLTIPSARASERRRGRRLEKKSNTKTDEESAAPPEGLGQDEEDEPLQGYSWPPPQLPGEEKDFWEGPQWNAFGFFVQYLWAFGIVFAVISGGIAVASYNEGATDFKETPAYKESKQSQELLEGPDSSDSDVFESNPTEVAPSLSE